MKSELTINPKQILAGISGFTHRYHILIFSVIVLGGLSAATFALYQTAVSAQSVEQGVTSTKFDSATITKIRGLRSSDDDGTPLDIPKGRSNPFQE